MLGWRIHWRTTPSNVPSPRPSLRDWAKAMSRFGPTTPLALARASVWQRAHSWVNSVLPFTRFGPLSRSEQPDRKIAAAAAMPNTTRPLSMGCILTIGGDRRAAALGSRDAPGVPRGVGCLVRDDGRREPGDAAVRALRAGIR